MEDPERPGRRLPAVGGREADESQTRRPPGQQTGGSVPRPVPRQAPPTAPPTAPPRAAPGVPMAGRSFAQRQAEMARAAKGIDTHPPPPVPRERPQPPVAAPPSDLDEDFDLDEEPEVYYEEEASPVSSAPETPSRIYSTRRALAEQVNEEVGQHQYSEEASGLVAIRERREAWKKTVTEPLHRSLGQGVVLPLPVHGHIPHASEEDHLRVQGVLQLQHNLPPSRSGYGPGDRGVLGLGDHAQGTKEQATRAAQGEDLLVRSGRLHW